MSANRIFRHRSFVLLSCTAIGLAAIATPADAITVNLFGTPGVNGVNPGDAGGAGGDVAATAGPNADASNVATRPEVSAGTAGRRHFRSSPETAAPEVSPQPMRTPQCRAAPPPHRLRQPAERAAIAEPADHRSPHPVVQAAMLPQTARHRPAMAATLRQRRPLSVGRAVPAPMAEAVVQPPRRPGEHPHRAASMQLSWRPEGIAGSLRPREAATAVP
jgi:hypothetical protein